MEHLGGNIFADTVFLKYKRDKDVKEDIMDRRIQKTCERGNGGHRAIKNIEHVEVR